MVKGKDLSNVKVNVEIVDGKYKGIVLDPDGVLTEKQAQKMADDAVEKKQKEDYEANKAAQKAAKEADKNKLINPVLDRKAPYKLFNGRVPGDSKDENPDKLDRYLQGENLFDHKGEFIKKVKIPVRPGAKDYTCGICDAKFPNKNQLVLHITKVH